VSASAASAASAGSSGTVTLLGGAWSGIRRTGAAIGGAAAVAAAAVTLAVTTIPHDGGPADRPQASLEAGPAPGGQDVGDTTTVGESHPATPAPVDPSAGSGETASPSSSAGSTPSSSSPSSSSTEGPLADVDAGVNVGLGDGVDVDADVHIGLDLNWVPRLLGNGTLEVLVPNNGTTAVEGLEVDVQLSANAHAARLVSGSCVSPSGGLLDAVLGLVTSLTCGLESLAPGANATTQLEVQVTAAQQTASVTVRLHGAVLQQDQIPLPL
jgi:hypothetical protein